MSSPAARRSTRPRQSTAKYSIDPYASIIHDAFDDTARSDSDIGINVPVKDLDDNDDGTFMASDIAPSADKDQPSNDHRPPSVHSSDDSGQEAADDVDDVAGDDMDMFDDGDVDDDLGPGIKSEHGAVQQRQRQAQTTGATSASNKRAPARGLVANESRHSKSGTILGVYGPALADQTPAFQAVYKWKHDLCLPTRKCDRAGFGGFNNGFYRSTAQRQDEMNNAWKWYDTSPLPGEPSGRERIKARQVLSELDPEQAISYHTLAATPVRVVSGPFADQQLLDIPLHGAQHLDTAFLPAMTAGDATSQPVQRHGWYINLGQRIQCLDWAPNKSGPYQILALSTMDSHAATGSSHFEPRQGKSGIELWIVKADDEGYISSAVKPRLSLRLCTDWGDVKSLKWCPVPHADQPMQLDSLPLGLLAGVWTDGSVRILDLELSDFESEYETESLPKNIHCTRTAFAAKPPNGVFTSVAWLSSTGLVAGCSNGTISIFDLSASLASDNELASPMMHVVVQTAYILSVTTCYPSRPQIVCTASTAGAISMTDLLEVSPNSRFSSTHTIPSGRSRIGKSTLAWHDFGQSIITTDDNCGVFNIPLRRFFGTTGVGILPSNCIAHAVSPCHPFLAMGTVGGEAIVTDPMKRLVNSKAKIWNQTWFAHEYRPDFIPNTSDLHDDRAASEPDSDEDVLMTDYANRAPQGDGSSSSKSNDKLLDTLAGKPRGGKVRFLEGFKAENNQLDRAKRARAKDQAPVTVTIHEPESAVTSLAWNPNAHVGGWCAAGMASGLLRLEDLGKDTE